MPGRSDRWQTGPAWGSASRWRWARLLARRWWCRRAGRSPHLRCRRPCRCRSGPPTAGRPGRSTGSPSAAARRLSGRPSACRTGPRGCPSVHPTVSWWGSWWASWSAAWSAASRGHRSDLPSRCPPRGAGRDRPAGRGPVCGPCGLVVVPGCVAVSPAGPRARCDRRSGEDARQRTARHGGTGGAERETHDGGLAVEAEGGEPLLIGQHQLLVGARRVVGQDRRAQRRRVGQVAPAVAEVRRGGRRRVLDVLRVRHSVTVPVDPEGPPGAGDELQRPHRPVPGAVAVPATVVGVGDGAEAVLPVEDRPEDRGAVLGVEGASRQRPRLDLSDRGEQARWQVAGGRGGGGSGPVGLQQDVRDIELRGTAGSSGCFDVDGGQLVRAGRKVLRRDDRHRGGGRCRSRRGVGPGSSPVDTGGSRTRQCQHQGERHRQVAWMPDGAHASENPHDAHPTPQVGLFPAPSHQETGQ